MMCKMVSALVKVTGINRSFGVAILGLSSLMSISRIPSIEEADEFWKSPYEFIFIFLVNFYTNSN